MPNTFIICIFSKIHFCFNISTKLTRRFNFCMTIVLTFWIFILGEPSGKKIKLSNSAEYASNNYIPTPHLLNNSDPVRVGAGGDSAGLPFLSESFNEFFPQKCSKYNKKSSATKIRPNLYDKISDEIIVKVFSYLNRQSLGRSASVCQRYCFLFFYSYVCT